MYQQLLTDSATTTRCKTAANPALYNILLGCIVPSLISDLHLQVREAALLSVQEHQRVLAADAAPHQGSYQPLLAAAPPAVGSKARFRWPDHHAADLRHIDRSAFRSSPSCGSLASRGRDIC